jgi:short subunit dehydrogenase-like uncharacterized protein
MNEEYTNITVDVLVVRLNHDELNALAKRTRLIVNCVGPYHLYSTPVVEACAESGTHYIDVFVNLSSHLELFCSFY